MDQMIDLTDPVIEYKLEFDAPTQYFFSLLDPRFSSVTRYMCASIESIVGGPVEPIQVVTNRTTDLTKLSNYILMNSSLKQIEQKSNGPVIIIPEHEELNADFSSSRFVRQVLLGLVRRQGQVFVNPFTTSFMDIDVSGVKIIGPHPELATFLDSKVNHREFLSKIGEHVPEDRIYDNFVELKKGFLGGDISSSFVYAEYSSGGFESGPIRSARDLEELERRIRKCSLRKRFVAARIIDMVQSPNTTGIVLGKDRVLVLSVSDQLLDQCKYLGNIYPSVLPEELQAELIVSTRNIGLELAKLGYRGMYGCDYVLDRDQNWYVVDLNPRKQGGYLCNLLMLEKTKKRQVNSLADLELRCTTISDIEDNSLGAENPRLNFSWAHSKIRSNHQAYIENEANCDNELLPFDSIGTMTTKSFFPRGAFFLNGSMVGYVLGTDTDREALLRRIVRSAAEATELIIPSEPKQEKFAWQIVS